MARIYGEILDRGRENRQFADYDTVHYEVGVKQVKKLVKDAERFVEKMEKVLRENSKK